MAGMTGGTNNAEGAGGGGGNNKSKSTNAPQAADGSLKRKRGIFSKDCEFFPPSPMLLSSKNCEEELSRFVAGVTFVARDFRCILFSGSIWANLMFSTNHLRTLGLSAPVQGVHL
jgi:hypothetical protein